jgi:quinol monooxygenase YgiN
MPLMTYVVVARWSARVEETKKIEEILRKLVRECRKEPGVLQFTAHRSHDDPNEFLLYEQYKSEQAFLDHQKTSHFQLLVLNGAVPLLARRERLAYDIVE